MQVAAQSPRPRVLRDVMVPMRDGVRLATDIYLPEGPGPWPALLERTPYDKRRRGRTNTPAIIRRSSGARSLPGSSPQAGFAVVFQDCRGRYGSEGRFTKYRGEAEDGFDTLAWIAAQDWCDGQHRHDGHVLFGPHPDGRGLRSDPPALAAMVSIAAGSPTPIRAASASAARSSSSR
jgi:uncharacterized protein